MVYLGLGSNSGDRQENILNAVYFLRRHNPKIRSASVYLSEPISTSYPDPFFNTVIEWDYTESPEDLFIFIQKTEWLFGRDRRYEKPKGPRILDIDILLFKEQIIKTDAVTIPHKEMTHRKFVLLPLLELNPNLFHPETKKPFYQYLKNVEEQIVIPLFGAARCGITAEQPVPSLCI